MQQFEEPRFGEEEQRRIFARAAEMQREEGLALSASELEQVAMEAGIDPRYIRKAMAETRSAPPEKHPASPLPLYLLGTFFFAQMYGISGTVQGTSPLLYIPFALSLLLGIAWSRTTRDRAIALGTLFLWTGIVYGWCTLISSTRIFDVTMAPVYVTRILMMQALLVLIGHGMAALARKAAKKKVESSVQAIA